MRKHPLIALIAFAFLAISTFVGAAGAGSINSIPALATSHLIHGTGGSVSSRVNSLRWLATTARQRAAASQFSVVPTSERSSKFWQGRAADLVAIHDGARPVDGLLPSAWRAIQLTRRTEGGSACCGSAGTRRAGKGRTGRGRTGTGRRGTGSPGNRDPNHISPSCHYDHTSPSRYHHHRAAAHHHGSADHHSATERRRPRRCLAAAADLRVRQQLRREHRQRVLRRLPVRAVDLGVDRLLRPSQQRAAGGAGSSGREAPSHGGLESLASVQRGARTVEGLPGTDAARRGRTWKRHWPATFSRGLNGQPLPAAESRSDRAPWAVEARWRGQPTRIRAAART